MIFRRVKAHIERENWFAVFIDFLIVVVGVFIGIQVANWNEEQQLRQQAFDHAQRLEKDFGFDAWKASNLYHYHQVVLENAHSTLDDLTQKKVLPNEQLVIAAFRATQFNRVSRSSIYDELVTTGGIALLDKTPLLTVAKEFYEHDIFKEMQEDGKASDYRRLFRTLVPIDVQLEVMNMCGDSNGGNRDTLIVNLINNMIPLSLACKVTVSKEQVAAAAKALRESHELIKALRYRIASLAIQNSDYLYLVDAILPYRLSHDELWAHYNLYKGSMTP